MMQQATQSMDVALTARVERRHDPIDTTEPIRFADFLVLPSSRSLLRRGCPVELGSRAFDLLMTLLQARGRVVSKEEIVRSVWPTTLVDESNLRFQMTTLRRALGECRDMIKTIPGRGYLLIADDRDARGDARSGAQQSRSGAESCDARPFIFVIDEDVGVRDAICRLLRPFDATVRAFASLEALAHE